MESFVLSLLELPKQCPWTLLSLAAVGTLVLCNFLLSLLQLIKENHFPSGLNLKKFNKTGDDYAIVTGSTDGIGKEFALQLAKVGYNLVLISRTPAKLRSVQLEINQLYPDVTVKTLAVDFAQVREKDYDEIERIVSQYTVSILVNNVAVSHSMPTPFLEESEEQLQQIIDINITATLRMTKICLPPMAERKHGLIVNIGSFAGIVPTALLQTYSGSKAFLKTWSESLGAELKPVGVRVTHLNTYFVVSNMSKISRASLMVPTARDYVRAALKRLGGSKTHVTPYPWHNIMQWAMEKFVGHQLLIDKTCEMQQSIRKRALRKLAKQQ